jgi:hypothetical protein
MKRYEEAAIVRTRYPEELMVEFWDIQDELVNHLMWLRKYCHMPFCKKVLDCPKSHIFCSIKLNLSTAMAWRSADLIKFTMDNCLCYDAVDPEIKIAKLSVTAKEIEHYRACVRFHRRRHNGLFLKFAQIDITITEMVQCLRRMDRAERDYK